MMNVLNLNFFLAYRQINGKKKKKEKNLPFGIDTWFLIYPTPVLVIKLNQKMFWFSFFFNQHIH